MYNDLGVRSVNAEVECFVSELAQRGDGVVVVEVVLVGSKESEELGEAEAFDVGEAEAFDGEQEGITVVFRADVELITEFFRPLWMVVSDAANPSDVAVDRVREGNHAKVLEDEHVLATDEDVGIVWLREADGGHERTRVKASSARRREAVFFEGEGLVTMGDCGRLS